MRSLFISVIFTLATLNLIGQDVIVGNTTLTMRNVATGLEIPWDILWGADDHIWANERRGRVLRVEPVTGNIQTVLNIESQVQGGPDGEPGMLGMTLHPEFNNTPLVYIVYTYGSFFNVRERLVSYEWNGTVLENEVILLNNISGFRIHDGSRIIVTTDNKILMTVGDRGNIDLPQDMTSLNGKILRINMDGTIPADNPDPTSYVFSIGHRNPQGLCMGPDGIIYSSEHGPENSDEVNIIEANKNYGWPNVQGACDTPDEVFFCDSVEVTEPISEWSPCVAVNGLEYYNHPAIPEFGHSLLMAVLGGISYTPDPRISHLKLSPDGRRIIEEKKYFRNFGRLRDVCINPHNGAIYFATNGPEYPGMGPNRIVEYRNLDYISNSVPNTQLEGQFIHISPNPMIESSEIEFGEKFTNEPFEVISFNGKTMEKGTVEGMKQTIDVRSYPAGTYYISATNKWGRVTKTFIVQ